MSKVKICKWCGKEFISTGKEQICSDECRKESYKEYKQRYNRARYQKQKQKLKEREKKSNLDEKAAEAKQRGISYGQLMAEKYIASIRERKTL